MTNNIFYKIMGLPKLKPKISVQDYLECEKVSQIKNEYVDGEIFAMASTSKSHNRILGNLRRRRINGSE
jgi:Uma2 family endonuclease